MLIKTIGVTKIYLGGTKWEANFNKNIWRFMGGMAVCKKI